MIKQVCKSVQETPTYLLLGVLKSIMRYIFSVNPWCQNIKVLRRCTIALADQLFLNFKHQCTVLLYNLELPFKSKACVFQGGMCVTARSQGTQLRPANLILICGSLLFCPLFYIHMSLNQKVRQRFIFLPFWQNIFIYIFIHLYNFFRHFL